MEFRLPEDYRTYLTCLGNGGAVRHRPLPLSPAG